MARATLTTPCVSQVRANAVRHAGFLIDHVAVSKAVAGGIVKVSGRRKGPVLTDTRRHDLCGSWFVALKGRSHDGHDFVLDCLEQGPAGIIVSDQWLGSSNVSTEVLHRALSMNTAVVTVPDTQQALSQLCKHAMTAYQHAVLAITGSCGKTTCKSMVCNRILCCGQYRLMKLEEFFQEQTGVLIYRLQRLYGCTVLQYMRPHATTTITLVYHLLHCLCLQKARPLYLSLALILRVTFKP